MGSCAAPSAKGDDKFITTDYLQQCPNLYVTTPYFHRTAASSAVRSAHGRTVATEVLHAGR
ncbi:hypothetical protein DM081_30520 [Klebsiella pneumoniae]|nr:hypothetical protein [Klebsiella pneumoniae]MDT9654533.1 hypothetical protein [Klebsiella pneumoniae]PZA96665.1 hypothetical protein C3K06_28110 [Klebsiella pneumoniae subsp. pneumoniae]RCJ71088.1 hypothetical protein DM081_30520 [Klebsiella pneumoniae]RWT18348.1 hypothetical protein DN460_26455 [Enterobacter cloacae]